MSLLTVKNLSVQFEDRSVVEDLSFQLEAGERLSILGPNGAGKTVLLKALLDLVPHDGEVVWAPEVRIGYVPQKIDADTHLPLTFTDLFRAKCTTLKIAASQRGGRRPCAIQRKNLIGREPRRAILKDHWFIFSC